MIAVWIAQMNSSQSFQLCFIVDAITSDYVLLKICISNKFILICHEVLCMSSFVSECRNFQHTLVNSLQVRSIVDGVINLVLTTNSLNWPPLKLSFALFYQLFKSIYVSEDSKKIFVHTVPIWYYLQPFVNCIGDSCYWQS